MKIIKIALILLICTSSSSAQMYVNAFTGYSFSNSTQYLALETTGNDILNAERMRLNYGKGMNLGAGLGYIFNDNISFEVTINTQFFTKSSYTVFYDNWVTGPVRSKMDYTIRNTNLQIAPLVVYSADLKKMKLYLKAGLNFLYSESIIDIVSYTFYSESQEVDKGGLDMGFRGGLGLQYQVSESTDLYAEYMSIITNYVYTNSSAWDHPDYRVDYSHMGLNIGIRYRFNRSAQSF